MKREKKLEENVKKAYAMIFKEFYGSNVQNRIKYHPKYDRILKNLLKLMDAIAQSMYEPIRATYPYLSLTSYIARIMYTRKQNKEVLVIYTERFKS